MSSAPERSSKGGVQPTAPQGGRRGVWIATAVALIAVIGIVAYAWLHGRSQVPAAAVATGEPTFPPPAKAGQQAPPLDLKAPLDTITTQTLAGKPYLLEIFATWCPHCQRMTVVLRQLRSQIPETRLSMVSVTGSPYGRSSTPDNMMPENQQDVDSFEQDFHTTWPSIYDPDLTVAKSWGLDGFPTIFVVNAKGKIVYSNSGEVPLAELVRAVRKAGA